jgi:eukaryotic-like serine/threonine-protein kinase
MRPSGPPGSARPPGPAGQVPPHLAVRAQAPGVRSSQEAPKTEVTLRTGDSVGGRFFVERYLGSSGGGISYLCNDAQTQEPVVVKVLDMPFPGKEVFAELSEQVRAASLIVHRNLSKLVGMGRTDNGEIFIAMSFVDGATLSQLVAQRRREGRTLSIRDTFTVLAHVCNALSVVHPKTAHGVLTPYNVYVNKQGVVLVGNLAFGRMVSEMLYERGEGPFTDSIYVAPEVVEDPKRLNPRSDIFSLGMIAAELLHPVGLPNDRKQARDMAVDGLAKYPPSLFSLISSAIDNDPSQRPSSVAQFREIFEDIAREVGAKLSGAPPPGALPIEPAVEEEEASPEQGDDLFGMLDLEGLQVTSGPSDDRYLVGKGGLDYGPFTEEQLVEQLYADQIDEHSQVLDRVTQDRRALGEMESFRKIVEDYIPIREERRRREAQARAELERKVKKAGWGMLAVACVAGLFVLGGMIWFWLNQPDPEPMPLDKAFASLDYSFLPPPSDFQAVAVDADILQSIFNPRASEEEIARQLQRVRSTRRRSQAQGGQGGGSDEDSGVAEVDMSGSGSTHHLTDHEIYQVILSDMNHLRRCIMQEINVNRSFRGVTVKFFIRPSGTVGGVQIAEERYRNRPVGECLVQRFRSMQFPEHGAISNRGVEFPFYVQ